MKNIKFTFSKTLFFLSALFTIMVGCERELSDEAVLATFPSTAEIFTDTPVGLGSNFYLPFQGSKPTAWSVDENEGYNSRASMRFDVPNTFDPEGGYAGAVFRIDGAGRDLTGYNALTFWAKGSRGAFIDQLGFGLDFIENKYQASISSAAITTNWQKYVIPIPDASKLIEERGVFWYSTASRNDAGLGYSFWIDDLKFENLGSMAQPRPAISNGEDRTETAFTGVDIALTGLTQTFNLGTGNNVTVNAAPSYFKFFSSNEEIATVNENGVVSIIGEGTAKITATLGGVVAKGSLELTSRGAFNLAPTPTRDPSKVISIYSDSYTNVPVDFFNGYWEPFQTTQSSEFSIDGNSMINYTNFNFVGNQFANPTVDATQKSNLHINMYIPNSVPANIDFLITVVDFGADQADGGGDDTREQIFFNKALFVADSWITLEFPITMNNRNNIGLIIYENINGSSLSNFYLDNIYFYEN